MKQDSAFSRWRGWPAPWLAASGAIAALLAACSGRSESASAEGASADAAACTSCDASGTPLEDGSIDAGASAANAQPGAPSYGGCELFPDNNIFNTQITNAPIHAQSAAWIARVRSVTGRQGFGAGASSYVHEGSRGGIPVNIGGVLRTLALDGSYGQPLDSFTTLMPEAPRIEGEPSPTGAWDRHVLVIDPKTCALYEHINYRYDVLRGMYVTSASVAWDLKSNAYSTPLVKGGVGVEAAGIPMAPLIYRYEEVKSGEIRHPIRAAGDFIGQGKFVWPARASDGQDNDPNALPMGARLRLRAGTDLSVLGPSAKIIAKALMTYGMIIADSGPGGFGLGGAGDERWDDADLGTLGKLDFNQFDVVDTEGWRVSNESMEARIK